MKKLIYTFCLFCLLCPASVNADDSQFYADLAKCHQGLNGEPQGKLKPGETIVCRRATIGKKVCFVDCQIVSDPKNCWLEIDTEKGKRYLNTYCKKLPKKIIETTKEEISFQLLIHENGDKYLNAQDKEGNSIKTENCI